VLAASLSILQHSVSKKRNGFGVCPRSRSSLTRIFLKKSYEAMTALTRVTFPELPTPHGRRERCYHDCPSASPGGADQLDVKFYYLCWKHSGTICIVPQVDFLKSWLCLKNTPFQVSSVTLTRYSSVFTQPLLTIYLLIHLRQKSQTVRYT